MRALPSGEPALRTYPLHEGDPESFGAICGGEVTLLIEPQVAGETIHLVGGGHCARAIARLALQAGFSVTVTEDRPDQLDGFPAGALRQTKLSAPEFIRARSWGETEALVLVSRNHEIDREALAAALPLSGLGYLGMIGSRRKVRMVFDRLRADGATAEQLGRVYAPLGLDLGADAPAEIAISVLAEIMAVLRGRSGRPLRDLA